MVDGKDPVAVKHDDVGERARLRGGGCLGGSFRSVAGKRARTAGKRGKAAGALKSGSASEVVGDAVLSATAAGAVKELLDAAGLGGAARGATPDHLATGGGCVSV